MLKNICIGCFLILFLIVAEQLSLPSQEYDGWILLAVFAVLRFWPQKKENLTIRIILILFGALISARYMFFRTFFTLNSVGLWVFTLSFILYCAELFSLTVHFLGLFVNLAPLKYESEPLPAEIPSVDVFITTYKESPHLALMTALAALQMKYPKDKLNVYVLDEGSRLDTLNDPEAAEDALARYYTFQEKSKKYGFIHLFRSEPHKAKAGLINDALLGKCYSEIIKDKEGFWVGKEPIKTNGKFILALDCDHIPTNDFLENTIGFFSDSKVFLVQTPHFMVNPDALQRNMDFKKKLPPESWLFYFAMQNGLNRWNSAFFCGSAGVLRRTALEGNGGLSGDTITEDAETSIDLHAKGWKSIYFTRPMVAGLEAENTEGLIKQRSRWGQGMLQILTTKCPLCRKGLTFPQRLCYSCCCIFWLFPLARTVFLFAPLMFLFFNLNIYNASFGQVINYAFPHIFVSILLADYLYGQYRPFLASEVYESAQCFFMLPALARVLALPSKLQFIPTPKNVLMAKSDHSKYYVFMFGVFILMLIGCIRGVQIWLDYPLLHYAVELTMFWNLFNILVVVVCLGALWERPQRRKQHRYNMFDVDVTVDGKPAKIRNISLSGAYIETQDKFEQGQEVAFECKGYKSGFKIKRLDDNGIGGIFNEDDFEKRVEFVFGSDSRWEEILAYRTQRKLTSFPKTLYLLKIGFAAFMRSIVAIFDKSKRIFFISCVVQMLMISSLQAETITLPLSDWAGSKSETVTRAIGAVKMPIHLPARWDIQNITVNLNYENSTGVLPPAAQITAMWNEVSVGSVALFPEVPQSTAQINVPANIAKLDNELKFVIQQIGSDQNCSTANLWTTINLANSNITIDYALKNLTPEDQTNFEFLYDPKMPITYPVNFVMSAISEENVKKAMVAAAKIGLYAGLRPLNVTVSETPVDNADNYGVDVDVSSVNPKYAAVNVDRISAPLQRFGSVLINPKQTYTFNQMGQKNIMFRKSVHNGVIKFRIPSKTYLSPNQKMLLNLDLAYGDQISPKTKLTIYSNGKVMSYVPLNQAEGTIIKSYAIEIPVANLNKGTNVLTFEADLKPINAESCLNADNPDLYLIVLASSFIRIPDTGIKYELPNLGLFFNDGFPFDGTGVAKIKDKAFIPSAISIVAMVAQRRGTMPSGFVVSLDGQDYPLRDSFVFDQNVLPPNQLLDIQETLRENKKVLINMTADNADNMKAGILKLWNHKDETGNKLELLKTGEVKMQQTQTPFIFSNLGWLPMLNGLTANNGKYFVIIAILFILISAGLIKNLLPPRQDK